MSNIHCHACGKPRRKKMLAFTQNHVPYCISYWLCNDKHPSNPANPHKVPLFTEDEIKVTTPIKQLMTKPFSIRIGDYEMSRFLVELQEKQGFKNLSDTVRYCLELVRNQKQPDPVPPPQQEQPKPTPKQDLEEWTF